MSRALSVSVNNMLFVPVIGWFWTAVCAFLVAIPVWFLWSWLGPIYFPIVPKPYQGVGILDLTGLIILVNAARNWIKGWFA